MNGARTLPGPGPGNRRQNIGRFFTKIWEIPDYNSADSLSILCRWSADVLPVSARVSHDYLTSHGARPIFVWVSVEALPGTGRTTHGSRRTCRFSAFSISFHITLQDEESQCTERSKRKRRCSWYRHSILRIVKLTHRLANAYYRYTIALTSLISEQERQTDILRRQRGWWVRAWLILYGQYETLMTELHRDRV